MTAPNIAGIARTNIAVIISAILTICFVQPAISSMVFDDFFILFFSLSIFLKIPTNPPSPSSPNKTSSSPLTPFFASFVKRGILDKFLTTSFPIKDATNKILVWSSFLTSPRISLIIF